MAVKDRHIGRSILRYGIVLEHLSALDRLPVHSPNPRPDRPWRPPGDAAHADDRGLGALSRVRNPGPAGPWHLLAQPRRRRVSTLLGLRNTVDSTSKRECPLACTNARF